MKVMILLPLWLAMLSVRAQQKVFTEDELIAVMLKFHPVARQAAYDVDIARAGMLSARGGFDPRFTSEKAGKEFGGVNYYHHQSNEVSIPTWYGIDFFAGMENISGTRVNPEETRGSLSHMGFSVQPLQTFLMDKRRAALLQAKNFHQLTKVEQRIAINDLLREGLYSYWDWWEKFQIKQLVRSAFSNAENRFDMVKTAYQLGDRAAIDTLEAYTQVQAFRIRLSEAHQHLVNAHFQLATFMWTQNNATAELPPDVTPQEYKGLTPFTLSALLTVTNSHPGLTAYDFKLKALRIDKKQALQSLMPEVKIRYNQIGYDVTSTMNAPWFNNNYRFGASLSMPLRLSEARGNFQKAKLKMESIRLDQVNLQVKLTTKVKQYYTNWQETQRQLVIQNDLLVNTTALQKAEETRFRNGESSLFLINARELKTIEAAQKIIELRAKAQKAGIAVRWSAGILS